MWTALAIVLATILILIDKNGKWPETLRGAKWLARTALYIGLFIVISYFVPDTLTRWLVIGGCILVISLIQSYEKWWRSNH